VAEFQLGVDWFRPEGAKLIRPMHGTKVFHAMGYFTHHLTYAGVMLINVPLFAALALTDRGRVRLWWLAGALFSANGVLLSLGRSGWIGAVVGLGVLLLLLPRRWWMPLLAIAVAASLLLGALLATGHLRRIANAPHTPPLLKRALNTSLSYDKDRLYLWEAGWLAVQDRPWLGAGIGNEDYDFEAYRQIVSGRHEGYAFITRASAGIHNIYLQMAFATGFVGLAAYLSLFGGLLWWCGLWLRRAGTAHPFERGLLWGVAGALTGFSAASFFQNYFFDDEVANVLMIAVGLALHAGLTIRRERTNGAASAAGHAD
jgi:O-antigen ligase